METSDDVTLPSRLLQVFWVWKNAHGTSQRVMKPHKGCTAGAAAAAAGCTDQLQAVWPAILIGQSSSLAGVAMPCCKLLVLCKHRQTTASVTAGSSITRSHRKMQRGCFKWLVSGGLFQVACFRQIVSGRLFQMGCFRRNVSGGLAQVF